MIEYEIVDASDGEILWQVLTPNGSFTVWADSEEELRDYLKLNKM